MKHRISSIYWSFALSFVAGLVLLPRPALANFHVMEIEQIVGGVGGDPNAQAVQLQMRIDGQNMLATQGQLVALDATGNNPVPLSTFPGTNPTAGACKEILLVTPAMAAKTTPAVTGAYTMVPIPASYLPAGSLIFQGFGVIYWRVTWGGAAYTGPQTLSTTNDGDGSSGPAFASGLPSTGAKALVFSSLTNTGCPSPSTNNAADYSLTTGPVVLKNNAAATFTVIAPPPVPGLPGVSKLLLPGLLGLGVVAFAFLRRRRA
jgi:hypothetical protein